MGHVVEVSSFIAFTLGMVVHFIGDMLTRRVGLLRRVSIPEAVAGGLAVALGAWALQAGTGTELSFDLEVRDALLVVFFTTIGLNARFADLRRGGRPLAVLLGLTLAFMVLQNIVGLLGVTLFGLPTGLSVLVGSAALIGGHGTAIAWGPEIAATGIEGAAEIGIAAATFGLVLAALIGGPVAQFLIARHDLSPEVEDAPPMVGLRHHEEAGVAFGYVALLRCLLTVNLAILLGYGLDGLIAAAGVRLPLFVSCLLVGIVIANLQPLALPRAPRVSGTPMLALVSEFALSVFLGMSLMSMQLWTLAGLAGPLVGILALQVALTLAFCVFVLFPLMGRGYRAAVLGAGFAGFALGATPTAIANMTAVTKRHGPSPVAFIILPLVSAFFVDLANAFIIQAFLAL
ncbi:sodium/glutamate symporter [Oceanicella sp. SM1341]|uniref:sodium/glutamate symporter n=1 Tax=Oceanicella sp. SM1341 TaxID=1548889 RepID=UPI000E515218|nr:sodium/glutamate symporter [Oceanicella sp. SM1341]